MTKDIITKEEKDLLAKAMSLVIPLKKRSKTISNTIAQARLQKKDIILTNKIKNQPLDFVSNSQLAVSKELNLVTKKTLRSIRTNKIKIDGIFDLHGENRVAATEKLTHFIQSSYSKHHKLLLIITGKGSRNSIGSSEIKGILRSWFLNWIQSSAINSYIESCSEAHHENGGSGAFYIFLKKNIS